MTGTSRDRVYRTEGTVLRRLDIGEADRVLTLYTPAWGKLRVLAKGVRKPASKLGGHLDLFTRSRFVLARGRTFDIVTGAETIEAYSGLRGEGPSAPDDMLERLGAAYYLAELVEQLTSEGLENRPVWELLDAGLRALSTGLPIDLVTRHFELRLLVYLGYQPGLSTCVACGEPLQPEASGFSFSLGGVLCPRCLHRDPRAEPLSVAALRLLRLLAREDLATLARVRIPAGAAPEVEGILRVSLRQIAEREPRTPVVLQGLRNAAPVER